MRTRSQGDATPAEPAAPQRLGRFELRGLLGEGAFGAVHRAWDPQLDREVALKVLRSGLLAEASDVERFVREARAAAQLRHPHIVAVYEAGKAGSIHYIASAYVPGRTLREELKQGRRYTAAQAATLIAELADAVHYAHTQGVIHRDLKPSNVMLDERGEPHLLDFGLARRTAGDGLRTLEGVVLGTPAYMSPEQAQGKGHLADGRSDLWSLGVMLYEMLTGRRPFEGNEAEIMIAVRIQEPARLRSLDGSIPRDLETIVLKCLAKSPGERYATCADLSSELEHWLRGEPIAARPIGAAERAWRWTRRNPVVASLTLAAAALLLIITVGALLAATVLVERRKELVLALADVEAGTEQVQRQARRAQQALDRLKAEEAARGQEEARRRQAEKDRKRAEQQAQQRGEALTASEQQAGETRHRREQEEAERHQAIIAAQEGGATQVQVTQDQQEREREVERLGVFAEYVELISQAREALRQEQPEKCLEYLDACPADHRAWEWGCLKHMATYGNRVSQTIAIRPVGLLRFSEDSRLLALNGYQPYLRPLAPLRPLVFELATGQRVFQGPASHEGPWFVAEGTEIVTYAQWHYWFWDMASGRLLGKSPCRQSLESRRWFVDVVSCPGGHIWAISARVDSVNIQMLHVGKSLDSPTVFPLRGHTRSMKAALSPDERTLAVASGGHLYVWDVQRERGDLSSSFALFEAQIRQN